MNIQMMMQDSMSFQLPQNFQGYIHKRFANMTASV
jgi:hypothetical protein